MDCSTCICLCHNNRFVTFSDDFCHRSLLKKLINLAMKHSNDVALLHFLNKRKKISSDGLSAEQTTYLRTILKKINHLCVAEAYAEEIIEMRDMKRQKLVYESDRNQIQKQIEKLPKLEEKIRLEREKMDQLFLTYPVSVQQIIKETFYSP